MGTAGSARQKARPTPPEPIDPFQREEEIRARAHQIWLSHGGQGDSAEADWLQAEEEIRSEMK